MNLLLPLLLALAATHAADLQTTVEQKAAATKTDSLRMADSLKRADSLKMAAEGKLMTVLKEKGSDDEDGEVLDVDPAAWSLNIKQQMPTVATFSSHAHVKPAVADAFNITAELEHWHLSGLPQVLQFALDSELSDMSLDAGLQQPLLSTDYGSSIKFHYFGKHNESDLEGVLMNTLSAEKILESGWDPKLPLKIVIHGYTNNIRSPVIQHLKNAYLSSGKYNVVGVDWGKLCPSPLYITSRVHVPGTGAKVGEFVDDLIKAKLTELPLVHIIGHSLGAHVAGIAGKSMTVGKANRISGLDPAGPLFQLTKSDGHVWKTDAETVDIIHTNAGLLGKSANLGVVDFYPNGGRWQPGCKWDFFGTCSHSRSYELFEYSILHPKLLRGVHCGDSIKNIGKNCLLRGRSEDTAEMGDSLNYPAEGTYYLLTSSEEPYEDVLILL